MATLAVALFTGASYAQDTNKSDKQKGHAYGMKDGRHSKAHEELNLSQDQQNQIATLNQNFRTQIQTLRSQNLSKDERTTRMKALKTQHVEGIRALLNADQRTRFDQMQQQRGKKGEGKFKHKEKKARTTK